MTQKRNTTKILGCHIIQNTKWDCLVFYQDSAWFCIYQIDLKNKGKHNFFIMILWSLFNLLKGSLKFAVRAASGQGRGTPSLKKKKKFAVSSLVVQWLRLHAPNSGGPGLIPGWGTRSQCSSVQSLSRVRLFVTPWTAACQASLSITNSQSLLKLMSIESVMPPNHLILCRPLLLPPSIFPSIRVFSNESVLCIRWPKYWSFSFSMSFQWTPRTWLHIPGFLALDEWSHHCGYLGHEDLFCIVLLCILATSS